MILPRGRLILFFILLFQMKGTEKKKKKRFRQPEAAKALRTAFDRLPLEEASEQLLMALRNEIGHLSHMINGRDARNRAISHLENWISKFRSATFSVSFQAE